MKNSAVIKILATIYTLQLARQLLKSRNSGGGREWEIRREEPLNQSWKRRNKGQQRDKKVWWALWRRCEVVQVMGRWRVTFTLRAIVERWRLWWRTSGLV